MAFIDNPTISTLGTALGLGPLFEAAGGTTPPEAAQAPVEMAQNIEPPALRAKSAQNIPEYKSRPYLPHIMPAPSSRGGVGPGVRVGGTNPIEPGNMDPATLQSPQVQQLLQTYGVQAPTTPPDPNLFIHNPEAFQKHPVAAGLLERGMEGLAYAHPGNNFLESLIGGARGMQEAGAARASQANAQTMAPINQAAAIQSLLGVQEKQRLEQQKANDDQAYHTGLIAHYHATDATREERIASVPPRFDKTGRPYYYSEDPSTHVPSWKPDENFKEDPKTAVARAIYDRHSKDLQTKYPSDDPKEPYKNVPADVLEKTFNEMTSQESIAAKAAEIHNTDTRAAATVTAAGMRASASNTSGNGKLSQQNRARIAQLNRESAQHQKAITPQNSQILGDDGKIILAVPGNPDYENHVRRHQAAIARNNALIDSLTNGSGTPQSGPPPVAPTSNGAAVNPFRR